MNRHTVLVTGASGFIGTNLTKMLLDMGCIVIAFDRREPRFYYPEYRNSYFTGTQNNAFDLLTVKGDIRDKELLHRIFRYKIDYVIHLAAVSTIQMGVKDYRETMSINVDGTEVLLRIIQECGGVKGFIYASSDKVYGRLQKDAYYEEDFLAPLESPYDRSKAEADRMVQHWSKEQGLHGIVLRFCNIYGRYDFQTTRIIPGTIHAVLENRRCVLRVYRDANGDIHNFKRDFLYVDDLCNAIWNIIEKLDMWNEENDKDAALWGEAFNLGTRHCYPMDEVIGNILKLTGSRLSPQIELSEKLAEIAEQSMDFTKANRIFGFSPETSLEKGLEETVSWWKRYHEDRNADK